MGKSPTLEFDSKWDLSPAPESTGHINLKDQYDLFIGGKWVKPSSKKYFDTINPATEKVIAGADVKKAIVYGVATDYCDRAAVIGMLERGVEVYFVIDAAKEVNINFQGEVDMLFGRNAIAEMVEAGAKPITTENVLAEMYLRH